MPFVSSKEKYKDKLFKQKKKKILAIKYTHLSND